MREYELFDGVFDVFVRELYVFVGIFLICASLKCFVQVRDTVCQRRWS